MRYLPSSKTVLVHRLPTTVKFAFMDVSIEAFFTYKFSIRDLQYRTAYKRATIQRYKNNTKGNAKELDNPLALT